jgi:hypothetical protein
MKLLLAVRHLTGYNELRIKTDKTELSNQYRVTVPILYPFSGLSDLGRPEECQYGRLLSTTTLAALYSRTV